jgi:hypothetical protein
VPPPPTRPPTHAVYLRDSYVFLCFYLFPTKVFTIKTFKIDKTVF